MIKKSARIRTSGRISPVSKPAARTQPAAPRPQAVFFGSGPVAAKSLELLQEWCDVEAVVTKPQPPHHRGTFPVIAVAQSRNMPLYYATNRRELDEVIAEAGFTSRVAVLVDYGIIVSRAVIDSFPLGIVNSHFSILPEWRGADPISFAILSGQPQTGVSLMLLVQAMDEGPLLSFGTKDIPPDATTPQLTEQLILLSDSLLETVLPSYAASLPHPETGHPIQPLSQQTAMKLAGRPYEPTYSRKLSKEDGVLDFSKPAAQLEREVRAYVDWPKSRTIIAGKDVVVTRAHVEPAVDGRQPGQIFSTADKKIAIATSDGLLVIDELKPAGKATMTAASFLAGNKL